MAFNPCSPKWGEEKEGEGGYPDGWWNKARIQLGGEPEVSRAPSRPPDAKVRGSSGEQQD